MRPAEMLEASAALVQFIVRSAPAVLLSANLCMRSTVDTALEISNS
jgi:hypothetical protein